MRIRGKYVTGVVAGVTTNTGSLENPAVKVNANATAPGTTAGANGLSVDVTANTGGEPGAAVTGDGGTGTGATGVSAAPSTGRDPNSIGDGTLSVRDVGSGGVAGLALH